MIIRKGKIDMKKLVLVIVLLMGVSSCGLSQSQQTVYFKLFPSVAAGTSANIKNIGQTNHLMTLIATPKLAMHCIAPWSGYFEASYDNANWFSLYGNVITALYDSGSETTTRVITATGTFPYIRARTNENATNCAMVGNYSGSMGGTVPVQPSAIYRTSVIATTLGHNVLISDSTMPTLSIGILEFTVCNETVDTTVTLEEYAPLTTSYANIQIFYKMAKGQCVTMPNMAPNALFKTGLGNTYTIGMSDTKNASVSIVYAYY
jgi:hypothetical protein